MIFGMSEREAREDIDKLVAVMMTEMAGIYKNKSSDEYKMCGDISKTPMYDKIENMIANLDVLKGFSKNESNDLHSIFNVLHRPIFKKNVQNYINEPSVQNTAFACIFTCGYRLLVGELSRIYASTDATEKGIVYKPEKFAKANRTMKMINIYKNDIETKIDKSIRENMNTPIQESWQAIIGAGINVLSFIKNHHLIEWGTLFSDILNGIFGTAKELNPISLIDDILSESYDKKVQEFDTICKEYQATKDAYDEYMKIPEAQRNKKIESRYIKNMEKYNIKMKNLQAKLKHYDQRSEEEAKELANKIKIEKTDDTEKPSDSSTKKDESTADNDFDF